MFEKLALTLAISCISAMAVSAYAQPGDGQVVVRRAFYGSSAVDPRQVLDVTQTVSDRCNGKSSCQFKCSAHELKVYNPYPGHPKQCTVSFYCGDRALRTIVVSAGAQAALSCENP
ncbi:MAG TPA: hypothetical protein VME40_09835 [Caulobacteraceae bacterium]|nr:hypothetical protein [Caulobacteraceae bacterium]